jgi:hypothetical protein
MLKNKIINKEEKNNVFNYFKIIIKNVYDIFVFFIKTTGIYLLWICLHYISSQLYIEVCVPKTIKGFLMSPFMISTPQCQSLRWVVYNGANIINNMWILFGTWICSTILIITSKPDNNAK